MGIVFNEDIAMGSGEYKIASGGTVVCNTQSSCGVYTAGNTLWAEPDETSLTVGTTYDVTITSGILTDLAGNTLTLALIPTLICDQYLTCGCIQLISYIHARY